MQSLKSMGLFPKILIAMGISWFKSPYCIVKHKDSVVNQTSRKGSKVTSGSLRFKVSWFVVDFLQISGAYFYITYLILGEEKGRLVFGWNVFSQMIKLCTGIISSKLDLHALYILTSLS